MGRSSVGATVGWRGVTLPELLVVVSIIGLSVAVAVPSISRAIRSARLNTAASQFAVSLKAARMIAVSRGAPLDFVVRSDPDNYYEYEDKVGRLRRFTLPPGIRIVSTSSPITFQPNGSVAAPVTTTLEAELSVGTVAVWEIRTNVTGVSKVVKS